MRLLDRYIGFEFLKAFALSLFGLVFMFMVITIMDNLNMETDQPKIHLYLYFLYSVPQITALVMPAGLMFAVCFTVAQFTMAREMVAIHSAGVSFYRAIAPILIFGGILSIFIFVFQNFVVTPANEAAANELSILKKNTGTVKDLVWQKNLRGRKGYYFIYYLDAKKQEIMGGFNYLEMGNNDRPKRMIQAEGARYIPQNGDWELHHVKELLLDQDLRVVSVNKLDTVVEHFPDSLSFFIRPARDPGELNIFELRDEIGRRINEHLSAVPYQVQFHANIAFPFMSFIVALVGSIAGGMGSLRSGGPLIRSLLLSIATIFIYQLTFRLGLSMGNNDVLPPAVAGWGPTLIFFGIAVYFVARFRK